MLRKFAIAAGLFAAVSSLGGCLSLTNWDDNNRMFDHFDKERSEMRKFANKYLWNYDADSPFED